ELKEFLLMLKKRPKVLLHSCCAPCSSHVISLLRTYVDLTIFYSNDNIYPLEEYQKRLEEEIRFCKEIDSSIEVIFDSYQALDYANAVKGYETLGEKTERCYKCYELRLEKTAKKAKELGFDYFTTTLSISPHKIAKWINEIGVKLEEKYGVPFLYSDFKKEDGYKHSIELSKQYGLYRQDYCGCLYSKEERRNVHAEE
ncbi:MAG: epoxyqueuosine reductase QueH, partial [Anaeroplasmataceae bacterium]|nr:epoxyqueuosine reductase QueH [Anaeroplasmataceae bacterium]